MSVSPDYPGCSPQVRSDSPDYPAFRPQSRAVSPDYPASPWLAGGPPHPAALPPTSPASGEVKSTTQPGGFAANLHLEVGDVTDSPVYRGFFLPVYPVSPDYPAWRRVCSSVSPDYPGF